MGLKIQLIGAVPETAVTALHSKCSPLASSICIIWELVTNADSQAPPRPMYKNLQFNEILKRFIHILKFEKQWYNDIV